MKFNYEPLISVIIPVYRVEKYLPQCLDSVINQSYKNLEIICVNDFSDDKCLDILNFYAKKDARIKIINNNKNLGLGLSRNEGLKVASGEYIHCLDSDDWMNNNGYEILVKYLNEIGQVDIIRFCYDYFYEDKKQFEYSKKLPKDIVYRMINVFSTPKLIFDWVPSAWAKLIKTDFIRENNLFYNDYKCLEDVDFSIKVIVKSKSVLFINESIMTYRANRKNSLLTKKTLYFDYILKDAENTEILISDFPEQTKIYILSYVYKHLIGLTLDAYYKRRISFIELKRIFKNYLDYSILNNRELFESEYNAKLYKKIANYSALHFWFSFVVRKFIKKHFRFLTELYFNIKKRLRNAS